MTKTKQERLLRDVKTQWTLPNPKRHIPEVDHLKHLYHAEVLVRLIICFAGYIFCELLLLATLCLNAFINNVMIGGGFLTYALDWIEWRGYYT
jgi:hypothetical protein